MADPLPRRLGSATAVIRLRGPSSMAVAGPMIPDELRTSGLALLQTGQVLGRAASSVLFGALWTWFAW